MREKRRNGRVTTKTSVEDEIVHLRGLDLKGLRARSQRVNYRLEKRASAGRWSHFCEAIACAQGEHRRSG